METIGVYPVLSEGTSANHNQRVLVIEDNPMWQSQIRRHLVNINPNIEVIVLSSVESFYDQDKDPQDFNLIIADQFLGSGRTGLEFWKELESEYFDTPFLITSGLERSTFDRLTGQIHQPPQFIEKPFDFASFKNQFETLATLPSRDVTDLFEFNYDEKIFESVVLPMILTMAVIVAIAISSLQVRKQDELSMSQEKINYSVFERPIVLPPQDIKAPDLKVVRARLDSIVKRAEEINRHGGISR